MKLQKSPAELEQRFEAAFPQDQRAERRKMFGYASGVVNGNMFGGLFEDQVVLRLSDAERELITSEHGARAFEPMGRPMKGFVCAPPAIRDDAQRLGEWVGRAFEYTASLPAKEKKPRKAAR